MYTGPVLQGNPFMSELVKEWIECIDVACEQIAEVTVAIQYTQNPI